MACYTQEEIAARVGISKAQVNELCSEMADLPKLTKPQQASADHADLEIPIYNVWK